jgi:hypothetical protein
MSQDALGELAEPRSAREPTHERVDVLGVMALFADLGGTADRSQAFERIS